MGNVLVIALSAIVTMIIAPKGHAYDFAAGMLGGSMMIGVLNGLDWLAGRFR